MDKNIILALCEGPHDVAFLNKILKTDGFKSNDSVKLGDFPSPMNHMLAREASKSEVKDLNIQEIRQTLLPTNSLKRDETYLFLYSLGGDGKKASRKSLLEKVKSYIPAKGEIKQGRFTEDTTIKIVYFFDADNNGVARRLLEVKNEIKEILTSLNKDSFTENGSYEECEGLKTGCYIFTGVDNNLGKLENILLPLMTVGNEQIFSNANSFLDENHDENRLFPFKIKIGTSGIFEERSAKTSEKYKFDKSKSLIGTVGQLQQSGGANTVCIGFTDYLTLEKISTNPKCKEIIDFINNA
ncbi:DUF3226 domain-containing protein [Flavobacterium acetivorans]|uniref:DUF3226 domain-containing protein n=1 Tax=Flavobacterium acetivorans TaxID=2893883 RepID=UPI001E5AC605|nr:DUF3226 domain-containing protein [Flavobacterium sp. F-29]UFH35088.1 hypothetical protein LNP19_13505 [Flavobacterium sp. F-29]